jgi:G3E family GTPase
MEFIMSVRFVMVGGFLGAGKTTTLARLARHYQSLGQRVGLVTNDQAEDLVDTNSLRAQGFAVREVPGACFCCKFDELAEKLQTLSVDERPQVILAEPVGSCTDLVATVVQPLKALYAGQFAVAPYAVLFKPSHGLRILKNQAAGGFSPRAAYIFRKQLEEADAIVLNRIDELPPASIDEVAGLVADQFPGVPILRMSASTGAGFDAFVELLAQDGQFGRRILDIDYDTYAAGEAELGWVNASAQLRASQPVDLDTLLLALVRGIRTRLETAGGEIAHLKVIGQDEANAFGVANVVSGITPEELSLPSRIHTTTADLTVNARVALDPAMIEAAVREVLATEAHTLSATIEVRSVQSLRPGRPTPTHRYPHAVV